MNDLDSVSFDNVNLDDIRIYPGSRSININAISISSPKIEKLFFPFTKAIESISACFSKNLDTVESINVRGQKKDSIFTEGAFYDIFLSLSKEQGKEVYKQLIGDIGVASLIFDTKAERSGHGIFDYDD